MRLLFSSFHCYLDPSSGAALCTCELLELLTAHGADCRVLTTGILDPEGETTLDEVLATLELPCQRFRAELAAGCPAEVIDLSVNGVRVTVMPTASSRADRSRTGGRRTFSSNWPGRSSTASGLTCCWPTAASLELMRRARQRCIAVVFHLLGSREAIASRILLSVILPICVHLRYLRTRIFESSLDTS